MRPGKPLMFGAAAAAGAGARAARQPGFRDRLRDAVPAAGARPPVRRREQPPPTEPAILGAALRANDHRADHLRAKLERDATGGLIATAFERQDSAMLALLAQADALILRAPHAPALEPGAMVDVIRLAELGI